MTPAGRLTDACTFDDVKNTIMKCSVRPGQEDNPFFDARPGRVVGNTSTDRFILGATHTMRTVSMEAVQTMKAMKDELMMVRSAGGRSSYDPTQGLIQSREPQHTPRAPGRFPLHPPHPTAAPDAPLGLTDPSGSNPGSIVPQ